MAAQDLFKSLFRATAQRAKLAVITLAMTSLGGTLTVGAQDFDNVTINTIEVGGGVYMLEGRGGNIGVSIGEDGVFLIDDQFAPLAPKILKAIAGLSDKPVDYVINTHWHFDHTGGNEAIGETGAAIVAHDNVRVRMAAPGPRQSPEAALPVITFSDTTTFHYNGHEIHAFHPKNAHTDGDAVIVFRDLDIIHAGDVFFNGVYPFIDVSSGGSLDGYIAALEAVNALAGPATKIIPGHGPLADKAALEAAIAMLRDAKGRVSKLIGEGKSLDEVKAVKPLADYDEGWGNFFIKPDQMLEMLYSELSKS